MKHGIPRRLSWAGFWLVEVLLASSTAAEMSGVACTDHDGEGDQSQVLCDKLPNGDGEGCDYYESMAWDCYQCEFCPGGWISDRTDTHDAAEMVEGCCTGICGNTDCGGPVPRSQCPGCRREHESGVACFESLDGESHGGEVYCDELPNHDGEACDHYERMEWDCHQCEFCPGGWISDDTNTDDAGEMVEGCCTGICGNTECGGPVPRFQCPGCRREDESHAESKTVETSSTEGRPFSMVMLIGGFIAMGTATGIGMGCIIVRRRALQRPQQQGQVIGQTAENPVQVGIVVQAQPVQGTVLQAKPIEAVVVSQPVESNEIA